MKNTIVICGYGPGISQAVARRFGKAGHPVALIARNVQRLTEAVTELNAEGIQVQAFPADLSDVKAIRHVFTNVHGMMGPIGILHWNVFLDIEGDLLSTPPDDLSKSFDLRVVGYITAVQESKNDLMASKGTVLVTSGVMALDDPQINAFAVDYAAIAIGVAAQRKTTHILAHTFAPHGIHVGEVIVNGFVEGTPGAIGKSDTVAPTDVADQFWELHTTRQVHSVIVGKAVPIEEAGIHG
ncbi:SDR family NAD(P)-dependent oxidoreductase [Serratia sp. DD3]|uniref:SDR family NAD(P)-dependent oxidoreductase n=1 Tax=Serratia sp. DD3 TaxID=1410619 RepID=UPI0003C4F110|nr:SDR family NAD(P)-dependent oxidoreductase [Serratia sp. DD3]KEY60057.1 2,3-dihydro-2,3-dihydroxybenzoate dehydrogenase [Serratia sp. DD3]